MRILIRNAGATRSRSAGCCGSRSSTGTSSPPIPSIGLPPARPTVSTSFWARTPTNTGCSWRRRARSSTSPMRRLPAPSRRTDCRLTTPSGPIARRIPGAAPATCSRPFKPTGTGASPRSAWPRRMRNAAQVPTCTSSRGGRRSSTDCSVRAMRSKFPSSSTRSGTGRSRSGDRDPPQQLADTMHATWVAFATYGCCTWPKYDSTRRATMRFDVAQELSKDPHAERAAWEGALAASR